MFQIIGEALYQIDRLNKTIAVTEKEKIIKLRHLLTHDYDLIDYSRLWLYTEKFLPAFLKEIEDLLTKEDLDNLKKRDN